jgi:hypothetical protein
MPAPTYKNVLVPPPKGDLNQGEVWTNNPMAIQNTGWKTFYPADDSFHVEDDMDAVEAAIHRAANRQKKVVREHAPGNLVYALGSWLALILPEWVPSKGELTRMAWWLRTKTNTHIEVRNLEQARAELKSSLDMTHVQNLYEIRMQYRKHMRAALAALQQEMMHQPTHRNPVMHKAAQIVTTLRPVGKIQGKRWGKGAPNDGLGVLPVDPAVQRVYIKKRFDLELSGQVNTVESIELIVDMLVTGTLQSTGGYSTDVQKKVDAELVKRDLVAIHPFTPPPPDPSMSNHSFADFRHVLEVFSEGNYGQLYIEEESDPKT